MLVSSVKNFCCRRKRDHKHSGASERNRSNYSSIPSSDAGFTLMELLLVLTIIGVLAGLVVPRFADRSEQARTTGARLDVSANLPSALDLFEMDNGYYPSTAQGLQALLEPPTVPPLAEHWNGPYLKHHALPKDPWGNSYVYRCPASQRGQDYELFSCGRDGVEGGSDDIGHDER